MRKCVCCLVLIALAMFMSSGCALWYSRTRVEGRQKVTQVGLLGGLIPLWHHEVPVEPRGE